MEEMIEDTIESLEDQDELEEETQEQVDKILWEITKGEKTPTYSSVKLHHLTCVVTCG